MRGVDVAAPARESAGLSGADIALVCESAAEAALLDGVRTGIVRDITRKDLRNGLRQAHPSTAISRCCWTSPGPTPGVAPHWR